MILPATITLTHELPGCPLLRVNHPAATGCIALLGGQVLEWTPRGARPVLYVSPAATFAEGTAIRGGIPVCWPWFGPREGLPAHGCVRTRLWRLAAATSDDHGVRLVLAFASDAETLKHWPHPFSLELVIEMGGALDVALRMTHHGTTPAAITGALHTYLRVGAIARATVAGLAGACYADTLDHDRIQPQRGDVVRFDREVDRVYQSSGTVRVRDDAWRREITVAKRGSAATVVWNPWIEKSRRLADLPDDAWHDFLCIEAANAGADIIQLPPGGHHLLATRIEVQAPG